MITQERLKEILYYHPESGDFVWLSGPRQHQRAGCPNSRGYLQIRIVKQLFYAHRLAWLYVHGAWPSEGIDHIDGVPHHNEINNLRLAAQSENVLNKHRMPSNKTGHNNLQEIAPGKYVVYVDRSKKRHHVGTFTDISKALVARDAALKQLHGNFARVA